MRTNRGTYAFFVMFVIVFVIEIMIMISLVKGSLNKDESPVQDGGSKVTTTVEVDDDGLGVRIPGTPINLDGDFCIPISQLLCIEP